MFTWCVKAIRPNMLRPVSRTHPSTYHALGPEDSRFSKETQRHPISSENAEEEVIGCCRTVIGVNWVERSRFVDLRISQIRQSICAGIERSGILRHRVLLRCIDISSKALICR